MCFFLGKSTRRGVGRGHGRASERLGRRRSMMLMAKVIAALFARSRVRRSSSRPFVCARVRPTSPRGYNVPDRFRRGRDGSDRPWIVTHVRSTVVCDPPFSAATSILARTRRPTPLDLPVGPPSPPHGVGDTPSVRSIAMTPPPAPAPPPPAAARRKIFLLRRRRRRRLRRRRADQIHVRHLRRAVRALSLLPRLALAPRPSRRAYRANLRPAVPVRAVQRVVQPAPRREVSSPAVPAAARRARRPSRRRRRRTSPRRASR